MLKAPRKRGRGVGSIAGKETAAKVGDATKFPLGDQLAGILHHGSPAIVESNPVQHASHSGGAFNVGGLLEISPDRLLTEDVLAGSRSCDRDFPVHAIGSGDVDDLHLGIANHVLPVAGRASETKPLLRVASA